MSRFFWYSLEKLSTVYLELAVRVNVHCFQAWWIIGINLATFRKLDSKARLLEVLLCWIGAELRNERFSWTTQADKLLDLGSRVILNYPFIHKGIGRCGEDGEPN